MRDKINNKMDLLVSFDTTGSMYPCLTQVRRNVKEFINNMFSEFTDLRIGIIAHGDYCDKDDPYTIIYKELSRDADSLCDFVQNVKSTYGGDADECYELVLNLAQSAELGWREDAEKLFIMIGDASPHSPSYRDNKDRLDWVDESEKLRKLGVKVFAVHALASMRSSSRNFYKSVAEKTNGLYLTLEQFSEIVDLIRATVYQQSGEDKLNEFITIIRDSGKMTRTMDNNFKRLKGEEVEDTYERYYDSRRTSHRSSSSSSSTDVSLKEMGKLVPVLPSRFQVMTVDENCDIKGFVTKNGIEFKKGRGFYELTKAETVQQYKEVIMQDRETGEMFNGSQVREKLGLQPQSEKGGVNERLHASDAKKFRVFVQSTSVNRKLIAGTTFLYEIPDMEDEGTVVAKIPSVPESVAKEMKEEAKEEKLKKSKKSKKEVEIKEDTAKVKKDAVVKTEEEKLKKSKKLKKETTEVKTEEVKTEEVKAKEKKSKRKSKKKTEDVPVVEVDTESIEFSDLDGAPEVISASNKEIDEMLKGKENKLTEKLEGVKPIDKVESITEEKILKEAVGCVKELTTAVESAKEFTAESKSEVESDEEKLLRLSKEVLNMTKELLTLSVAKLCDKMNKLNNVDDVKEIKKATAVMEQMQKVFEVNHLL